MRWCDRRNRRKPKTNPNARVFNSWQGHTSHLNAGALLLVSNSWYVKQKNCMEPISKRYGFRQIAQRWYCLGTAGQSKAPWREMLWLTGSRTVVTSPAARMPTPIEEGMCRSSERGVVERRLITTRRQERGAPHRTTEIQFLLRLSQCEAASGIPRPGNCAER